ncbi:hypothetical protein Glove_91g141 [Diversispora epigaea]|uniref:Sel1 repeat family protein n=1 Tax=Diversispora epigaea TaxID=1348612 RepID=A0A397JCB4_9GLOM|nr:hypothetical protein Glove_91g141 [Diversispora epigaea]
MYLADIGVEKNVKKVYQIYSKLANEGFFITALTEIVDCYIDEKNQEKAFELYLKSAEKGILIAQNSVGIDRDYQKAFKWFLKAAEKGESSAQYFLGNCYENEWLWIIKDHVKAFE